MFTKRKMSALAFAAAFALGAGIAGAAVQPTNDPVPGSGRGGSYRPDPTYGYRDQLKPGPHRPRIGGFPKDLNGNGRVDDAGDETIPNLVRAAGDDGVIGYVRIEEMGPPIPRNPEEMRRQAEAYDRGERTRVPLWAEDGVTQVGWLTYGGVAP